MSVSVRSFRSLPENRETRNGWLRDWLAVLGIEQFAANRRISMFACGVCNCLIIPMEAGQRVFLDRYTNVSLPCQYDTQTHCACHQLPATIPVGIGTVSWVDTWHRAWCVTPPSTALLPSVQADGSMGVMPYQGCTIQRCENEAVVYLHMGSKAVFGDANVWICRDHLPAPAPEFGPDQWQDSEPEEFAVAREAVEVFLALQMSAP